MSDHHGAGPPEARGPMQLHWMHRLKAGPGFRTVVPKLVRVVTQIMVAIMSYYLRHKKNNSEQHCGFGSALPLEELHITPGG